MSFLRSCAGCAGHILTYPRYQRSQVFQEPAWCEPCRTKRMKGFDPQKGDNVKLERHQSGPFSDLVVKERNGDIVTVFPLGFPDRVSEVSVTELVPSGGYGR